MRFNLALAIVAMVEDDMPVLNSDGTTSTAPAKIISCDELIHTPIALNSSAKDISAHKLEPKFQWTETEQGIILGSFFYGYFITQIPGGLLAQRYSAKWVLGVGVLISAIFTILSPPAAKLGKEYFIACRFIEGLSGVKIINNLSH
jgi:ACS family sodium-dependent inorganic phosphate cotransporter-like MFS transporter 5